MEVKQEGDFKLKSRKMKNLAKTPDTIKVNLADKKEKKEEISDTIKVDLTKQKEEANAIQEQSAESGVLRAEQPEVELQKVEQGNENTIESESKEEIQVIQEITEEEVQEQVNTLQEEITEAVEYQKVTGAELPENIEKLVSFMKETGGTLEDYVRLNADYSNISEVALLKEYYKKTKPHLDEEDINIILEDFSYDEDLDDEKDIRKAKIALKEEVAKAKNFLEQTKSKYYDEIKLRPGVTQEQQKAVDFFNRYNQEQQRSKQLSEGFQSRTKNYFTQEFKGFDFNLGEKKFRYGIKNNESVAETQSDLNNFIKEVLKQRWRSRGFTRLS
jgi:hypothetical protein